MITYYILGDTHLLLFFWAFYNILYFGVKPSKSLSWILITFFFPFLGVFAFILFGINRKKINFFELKETKKRKNFISKSFETKDDANLDVLKNIKQKKISQLIYNTTNISAEEKNNVTLLKNGEETFKALNEALRNAKKFIHLQYYIIEIF